MHFFCDRLARFASYACLTSSSYHKWVLALLHALRTAYLPHIYTAWRTGFRSHHVYSWAVRLPHLLRVVVCFLSCSFVAHSAGNGLVRLVLCDVMSMSLRDGVARRFHLPPQPSTSVKNLLAADDVLCVFMFSSVNC